MAFDLNIALAFNSIYLLTCMLTERVFPKRIDLIDDSHAYTNSTLILLLIFFYFTLSRSILNKIAQFIPNFWLESRLTHCAHQNHNFFFFFWNQNGANIHSSMQLKRKRRNNDGIVWFLNHIWFVCQMCENRKKNVCRKRTLGKIIIAYAASFFFFQSVEPQFLLEIEYRMLNVL